MVGIIGEQAEGEWTLQPAARDTEELTMTQEQKVIKAKVGLLELAKQLGSVSQACKVMGYSRDSFYLGVSGGTGSQDDVVSQRTLQPFSRSVSGSGEATPVAIY